MDIHKWLEETQLPKQAPSLPDKVELPTFLHPKQNAEERPVGNRRRRKNSTSDSSILDTRPKRREPSPIQYERGEDDVSVGSLASSRPSHSSGSGPPSHRYARRPRRKTRLERYEPKRKTDKELGRHIHGKEKEEIRKSKCKSRHKSEKKGTGNFQSFHAKNVPKDRLTLRRRENLGLFNKGKASSPPRRRGLPDLVFSEMKFLQKHTDEPEAQSQQGTKVKRRKKDHLKAKQEEISAYFTASRPVLAKKDANNPSNPQPPVPSISPAADLYRQRHSSILVDNPILSVELPEKSSYLGFGSRGPRHESGSYISWSESVRAPSPVRPKEPIAQYPKKVPQQSSGVTAYDEVVVGTEAVLPLLTERDEIYRDVNCRSGHDYDISPLGPPNKTPSRSHSFPADIHSIRKDSSASQAILRETKRVNGPPSTAPAYVPYRRERRQFLHNSTYIKDKTESTGPSHPREIQESLDEHKGNDSGRPAFRNIEPQISTLGKLLRECETVFKEMRQGDGNDVHGKRSAKVWRGEKNQQLKGIDWHVGFYPMQRDISAQFSKFNSYHPRIPDLAGPSIYELQAQRQYAIEEEHAKNDFYLRERDCEDVDGGLNYLDHGLDVEPRELHEPELGGFDRFIESADEVADIGFRYHAATQEAAEGPELITRSNNVVGGGFWRPHRLY
ncbi:hypothetical protein GQ43DRAFT_161168 [Delitschia confertaspora ATCC 74209]|uniref:Uncharacterized protein n=1 Tax=Delitschia confertaspora ATCC 74209 TaxID=1513339 RepID=A0A9P4MSR7_9PLEO|nr:hypothetical protein GQ43DRAFT_161168 [Delitschia confertaspora ATCC 74209]